MTRKSLVVFAGAITVLLIGSSAAQAQHCPGPALSGTQLLYNRQVTIVPKTWNLLEVPAFSIYNQNPAQAFTNLCQDLNLPAGAQILQINAYTGSIITHYCGQVDVGYTPCQGIAVFSMQPASGFLRIGGSGSSGVEGSWPYTTYGDGMGPQGDHLYGIPMTIQSLSPEELCNDLGLPPMSQITRFDLVSRTWQSHLCNTVPLFPLVPGEAVIITGVPGAAGQPVATGVADIN